MAASGGGAIEALFGLSFADKLSEKSRLISDGGIVGRMFESYQMRPCFI